MNDDKAKVETARADRAAETDLQWARLERHFCHHAALVRRFRDTTPSALLRMWASGVNEAGERLSPSERNALIERHCELFGSWPQ